jgi:hypothetical protein
MALVVLGAVAWSGEPTVPELRRQLLEARSADEIGRALDALAERIGKDPGFADAGAFGDWLGELPDGKNKNPVVKLRRGWAYVAAKRGADAVPLLEEGLKDDPANGRARAYLGEALRQDGKPLQAIEMLATAVKAGYDEPHVKESVLKAAFSLRRDRPLAEAEGLPEYAQGLGAFLAVRPDAELDATAGRWLLDDFAAAEKGSTARGQAWAAAAAEHVVRALRLDPRTGGGARLAFDAAAALAILDEEKKGATLRFDLLSLAYGLGQPEGQDGHEIPQVMALLAEAALREGRFELAHRMARERLAISDSAAARRVLLLLPPDLGD